MIIIYCERQRVDYDKWADLGCTGWSFKDVEPWVIYYDTYCPVISIRVLSLVTSAKWRDTIEMVASLISISLRKEQKAQSRFDKHQVLLYAPIYYHLQVLSKECLAHCRSHNRSLYESRNAICRVRCFAPHVLYVDLSFIAPRDMNATDRPIGVGRFVGNVDSHGRRMFSSFSDLACYWCVHPFQEAPLQ